ncbi:MAG: hypothetical protein WBQ73_03205 [Candidatus Babeliales bacterium]
MNNKRRSLHLTVIGVTLFILNTMLAKVGTQTDAKITAQDHTKKSAKVVIYHCLIPCDNLEDSDELLQRVKEHGLSLSKIKPGLSNYSDYFAPDHPFFNKPYFPFSPILKNLYCPKNRLIGYLVDPQITPVYNQEYRFRRNHPLYQGSKKTLTTYLNSYKKFQKMRQASPDTFILFDHLLSSPFYVNAIDKRLKDYAYQYIPEVPIFESIPPEELLFFD